MDLYSDFHWLPQMHSQLLPRNRMYWKFHSSLAFDLGGKKEEKVAYIYGGQIFSSTFLTDTNLTDNLKVICPFDCDGNRQEMYKELS